MDRLLRRENLDLRLTPYRVLATSSRHGMVEFVDACAIAEILSTEGSILSFFRRHNPQVFCFSSKDLKCRTVVTF
jgi:phosphatidylinositol 3-kinase